MAKKQPKSPFPSQHLTVYLLQKGVNPTQALNKGENTTSLVSNASVLPGAVLYYPAEKSARARWRKFVEPAFDGKLPEFMSQHPSAVLFVVASKRTFAIPFGFGHTLINLSQVVADFGLMTALKVADDQAASPVLWPVS